jgi:hypothetical protein
MSGALQAVFQNQRSFRLPASLEALASASSASAASTFTFTSVNLGAASASRLIVVNIVAGGGGSNASNITAVTVGGTGLSSAVKVGTGGVSVAGIFYGLVTAGTSGNIVVTMPITMAGCAIAVYALKDLQFNAPYATASNQVSGSSVSTTMNTNANGFSIGLLHRITGTNPIFSAGISTRNVGPLVYVNSFGDYYFSSGYTSNTALATGVTFSGTSGASSNGFAIAVANWA